MEFIKITWTRLLNAWVMENRYPSNNLFHFNILLISYMLHWQFHLLFLCWRFYIFHNQLYTFPEGKISQEDAPIRRSKWGTASLIVRAPITPIVLPLVHHGLEEVSFSLIFLSFVIYWCSFIAIHLCKELLLLSYVCTFNKVSFLDFQLNIWWFPLMMDFAFRDDIYIFLYLAP